MPRYKLQTLISSLGRQPHFSGLLGSTFILGVAFSFVAPFLSKWGTEEVGMSPRDFGLFMTLTSLSAILVSTALAKLSDSHFARKYVLIAGATGGLLGFACYALIRDVAWLLLAGCSLQALSTVCFAQLFSHVRESYGKTGDGSGASSFTMSVVRVCFSFAWTVGPAIGSVVLIYSGFEGLFLAASGLYFAFLIGVLKFVPYREPRTAASNKGSEDKQSLWKGLASPNTALSFVAFSAIFAANAINMMNLPLALTRTLGGKDSDLGIAFGIGPVVEIPLMLWFGHLAGRGYQLSLIRIGVFITVVYFMGLYVASQPWHVFALQILSGASFAILTNIAINFFQDLLPGQMGLATSLFSNAGAVGNLAGMLVFGFVVEAFGYQNTFLLCSIVSAVAFVLILGVKPQATDPLPAD